MKKRVKIVTLGCRTNQYESQAYLDQLKKLGYEKGDEQADLCIVNTCTVTESADSSSRSQIRALIKKNPNAKIVVTGCMVENDAEGIKNIDQNIQIIPNKQKENLIEKIFPDEEDLPEFMIEKFDQHTRAFIKVQDGCNSYCTYCTIPYVRGRSRSRPMKDILNEVAGLVKNGYKEIVITGINVGDYEDGDLRLADLVREVDLVEGVKRLRISSIDPDEVDDKLLDVVINGKNTCPSMHIVLQSGSNVVLKRMNRKYTRQMFFDSVDRLKNARSDFTFTTDVIVGFPGESEIDFNETIDAIEKINFAKVHMFPYSRRKRTRAALYEDIIPSDVINKRKQVLLRVAEKRAFLLREGFVGRKMSVLCEKQQEDYILGHTDNFLPVKVFSKDFSSNDLIDVTLIENTPDGLTGKVINVH